MNQILFNNFSNKKENLAEEKKKKKNIFKLQLTISLSVVIVLFFKTLINSNKDYKLEKLSKSINQSFEVSSIYNVEKQINESSLYLGKILIPKIDLEYPVFNYFNEELLKIAPCKFYGVGIGEKGNIAIAGHNYNDKRFFGKLFELKRNDMIKLIDNENKIYNYKIFKIYETEASDLSCLENKKEYELTLVTCNNKNKKRKIIKASLLK